MKPSTSSTPLKAVLATVLLTAACASIHAAAPTAIPSGNLCGGKATGAQIEQDIESRYEYPMMLLEDIGSDDLTVDSVWNASLTEQNPKSLTLHCTLAGGTKKDVTITGATECIWKSTTTGEVTCK